MNTSPIKKGYCTIDQLQMYYEVYGTGKPLVLVHGGGSTIQTTFGNIIPYLAENRQVIAMDLQAHGRSGDRVGDLTFQQDADDIAALLQHLEIPNADFLGYSNGGQTLIELALRHTSIVGKLILASSFYKKEAAAPEFWSGFDQVSLGMMPEILRLEFLKVNNNQSALQNMFDKDVSRMKQFRGWSDEQIRSIQSPVLVINGNEDVGSIEHAVEMYRTFPNAQLCILPGKHGVYIGAIEYLEDGRWTQQYAIDLIRNFLA